MGVLDPSTSKSPYAGSVTDQNVDDLHGFVTKETVWFVDGTNGSDTSSGKFGWASAFATIQKAVTSAGKGDTILVAAKEMAATDTDPGSYAETVSITTPQIILIGVSNGRTQGGLPQIKKGSGAVALLTIAAPGVLIKNIGFNGSGSTGGGILLDDDGGATASAFGTTIENCHFKNCVGSTATNAATGGAIQWSANGGAWQVRIKGCRFYKNVGDVIVKGTGSSVPQDLVIEDCLMSGPAASVDCNIYVGGSGVDGIVIRNCEFPQLPALGSGVNKRYIILPTGTVGVIEGCSFACQTNTTGGTKLTFKASGTAGNFPTTVHIMNCYGQSITTNESAEITIA